MLSVALFAVGAFVAAGWLFTLCVIAGCAAGSLAVTGGRTARGLVLGAGAVPVAAVRAVPWMARGVRASGAPTLARPVLVTAALLVVFVPLLAGADAAFADLLGTITPDESSGQQVVLFLAVGLGTIGASYLRTSPPALDHVTDLPRTAARRDWVLPVGALVLLFAAFVAVQVKTLVGGRRARPRHPRPHLRRLRPQRLLATAPVTVLTLGVIAVVARLARLDSSTDRRWLRGLLGALSVLTLVIVASALARMWLYQQAYGFTVLRVLVSACELWLGVVYLLVLAAGVRLEGRWLARAVVGTGFAALVGLAALNPDRFIAERNVERYHATQKIDVWYLAELSDDALPALATLPDDLLGCALEFRRVAPDGWRSWNLGRQRARQALDHQPRRLCAVTWSATRSATGSGVRDLDPVAGVDHPPPHVRRPPLHVLGDAGGDVPVPQRLHHLHRHVGPPHARRAQPRHEVRPVQRDALHAVAHDGRCDVRRDALQPPRDRPQRGPITCRHNRGATNGRWNIAMYHECSSCLRCRLVGRRRSQWPTWSRHGPEIEVYEAIGASGVVTASHAWIEPQSCATTCTARRGSPPRSPRTGPARAPAAGTRPGRAARRTRPRHARRT